MHGTDVGRPGKFSSVDFDPTFLGPSPVTVTAVL